MSNVFLVFQIYGNYPGFSKFENRYKVLTGIIMGAWPVADKLEEVFHL